MKKCPFCAEDVQDAAVICKHCKSDLTTDEGRGATTAAPQKVTVVGVDPFAGVHTEIQGKKKGKITALGYMGIGIGLLFITAAFIGPKGNPGDEEMTVMAVSMGFGFCIASYLWVRR